MWLHFALARESLADDGKRGEAPPLLSSPRAAHSADYLFCLYFPIFLHFEVFRSSFFQNKTILGRETHSNVSFSRKTKLSGVIHFFPIFRDFSVFRISFCINMIDSFSVKRNFSCGKSLTIKGVYCIPLTFRVSVFWIMRLF